MVKYKSAAVDQEEFKQVNFGSFPTPRLSNLIPSGHAPVDIVHPTWRQLTSTVFGHICAIIVCSPGVINIFQITSLHLLKKKKVPKLENYS